MGGIGNGEIEREAVPYPGEVKVGAGRNKARNRLDWGGPWLMINGIWLMIIIVLGLTSLSDVVM